MLRAFNFNTAISSKLKAFLGQTSTKMMKVAGATDFENECTWRLTVNFDN